MANRRLLGSSHHAYFQYKTTLLLTLALTSCLISINCASFGRRSADQQQWRDQPDYNLYSAGPKSDATLEDLLLGSQIAPNFGYQKSASQSSVDNQLSINDQPNSISSAGYYFAPQSHFRSRSHSNNLAPSEIKQLYQQLVDPYRGGTAAGHRRGQLIADTDQSYLNSDSQSPLIVDYQPSISISNSDPSFAVVNDELSDYNTRLAELLQNGGGKTLAPRSLSDVAANNYNGHQQMLYDTDQDSLLSSSLSRFTDPKDSLFLLQPPSSLLDQSTSQEELSDKIHFGQRHDEPQHGQHATNEGQAGDIYQIGDDKTLDNKQEPPTSHSSSSSNANNAREHENHQPRNFTTLLEDEETTTTTTTTTPPIKTPNNDHHHNNENDILTTIPSTPTADTTTAFYGTIMTGGPTSETHSAGAPVSSSPGASSVSVFDKLYDKVVSYLPFLGHTGGQRTINQHPSASSSRTTNGGQQPLAADGMSTGGNKQTSKQSGGLSDIGQVEVSREEAAADEEEKENKRVPLNSGKVNQMNTKHSVSTPIELLTKQVGQEGENGNSRSSGGGNGKTSEYNIREKNDKLTIDRKQQQPSAADTKSEQMGTFMNTELDSVKITPSDSENDDNASKRQSTSSAKSGDVSMSVHRASQGDDDDEVELIKHEMPTVIDGIKSGEHKVNLIRQSSLIMPFKSNDELIVQTTSANGQPDSLLGKYIYAPEHHYHLNSAGDSLRKAGKGLDDDEHMYPHMSHRSYSRRLHPGDDVYGSYSNGLRPLYAAQMGEDTLSLVGNKTNDVYFLVMVVAFCAMAMAVVLSAGLFAYRVQQSRKSTSDADYPTYGVVGPNNMNGKCGAASFVGGYFGAGGVVTGPCSSASGSKNGSAKNLPDMYSASDSGMATGGKYGSKNRLSNEQSIGGTGGVGNGNNSASGGSTASGAGNRSNFMANQNAARMYHYQHQKQQMISSDRASTGRHTSASDLDSEDENDDGSYTVYECPGLASAHEMEIKNPLFNDDQTP